MISISTIAAGIQPSLTRKLFDMAKGYDDVVDFTLGDPDLPTHTNIKAAGCRAIEEGRTRYSQNAGLLDLRNSISTYYNSKESLLYDAQKEIIVTVGAMEGLYLSLLTILNPGDEVIIPAPYWINYKQMVSMCHAVPVIVDSDKGDLTISVESIRQAITPKTKAIIINTPNNPTGIVISQDVLAGIADLAITHNFVVIADEVYKTLMYDQPAFRSIVQFDGMRERTILINSFSKEFCMTGWRIGYVLAPEVVVAAMTRMQENVVACAPLPSQYAAIEALKNADAYSEMMRVEFRKRRDVLCEGIQRIDLLSCRQPDATFYLMVNIKKTGFDSEAFAYRLLQDAQVAVVPGITYGKTCEGYVRLAFTISVERIVEGVKRLEKFIKNIQ